MLSPEEVKSNYEKHKKIIERYIKSPRKEKIFLMLDKLEEPYMLSPASNKSWYHNAFPGGYLDHVNRVVEYSLRQMQLFEKMGGKIDFGTEELVFAGLFHDLGKIGDGEAANYLPQTDKWRKDKLDEIYTNNPDLDFMLHPDRSLFILQKFGIEMSINEFLGIKLHDGYFNDTNKPYFTSRLESSKFKTSLIYILHTADYLSTQLEYSTWKYNNKK